MLPEFATESEKVEGGTGGKGETKNGEREMGEPLDVGHWSFFATELFSC